MTSPFTRYNSYGGITLDERILQLEKRMSILEARASASVVPNTKNYSVAGASSFPPNTYSSTSFISFPALDSEYHKLSPRSRLLVELSGSGWITGSIGHVEVALSIGDLYPDYIINRFYYNNVGEHHAWTRARCCPDTVADLTPALPTGTIFILGRIRTGAGTTFNCNIDDTFSVTISEVS